MGTTTVERARSLLLTGEFARRLVHASGSVLPVSYLAGLATWHQTQALFVAGATAALLLEGLRHSGQIDWEIYDHLTREYEQDNVAGYALYMISSAVVVLVVEPQIAIPAVLMLMLGDPTSGLVGSGEFRRVKRPQALATMFAVSSLIALPFLHEYPLAVLFGAIGATVADGYKLVVRTYVIDDNLTIPTVAAMLMAVGVEVTTAV